MRRIQIALGSMPTMAIVLKEGRTTFGSSPSDDVVLPLPEIGRHHLTIVAGGQGLVLQAGEDELVQVNGRHVSEVTLQPTDVVTLGPYVLRILDSGGPAPHPGDPERPGDATQDQTPSEPTEVLLPVRRLVVLSGPDAGRDVFLDGPVAVIGRAPGNDLTLADPRVSWRHAALERTGWGIRVRDLGSRNGTFLDGHRILEAPATAGMRLRVGGTTVLLAGREAVGPARAGPPQEDGLAELVGSSPAMVRTYAGIRGAARSSLPVLLTGETGVGKELAARAVHLLSDRARKPFVPLNCAAIPRDIMESELFGHARGAFTGAVADHRGAFERAGGGTLFLDEIGELSVDLQPKLLRVLESGDLTPVGGSSALRIDARVVAATNQDVEGLLASGRFRRDLFFRVAVLRVTLPPLREHREDIPALVHHILKTAARDTGLAGAKRIGINPGALKELTAHDWPGNVRELRNLVHRAVLEAADGVITRELVRSLLQASPASPPGQPGRTLEEIEREAIVNCLRDCDYSRKAAARRLGIALSTLYDKIRRYGLETPRASGS